MQNHPQEGLKATGTGASEEQPSNKPVQVGTHEMWNPCADGGDALAWSREWL